MSSPLITSAPPPTQQKINTAATQSLVHLVRAQFTRWVNSASCAWRGVAVWNAQNAMHRLPTYTESFGKWLSTLSKKKNTMHWVAVFLVLSMRSFLSVRTRARVFVCASACVCAHVCLCVGARARVYTNLAFPRSHLLPPWGSTRDWQHPFCGNSNTHERDSMTSSFPLWIESWIISLTSARTYNSKIDWLATITSQHQ